MQKALIFNIRMMLLILVFMLAASFFACSLNLDGLKLSGETRPPFDYSGNFTDGGFWKDVKAQDHVVLCEYKGIPMSKSAIAVTDEAVEAEINEILYRFAEVRKITDRPVEYGDIANIDYDGSIDGIEFSGSSTDGKGREITIGMNSVREGFDDQIVGLMPRDTARIEITFSDNDGNDDNTESGNTNRKTAIYDVRVNYIVGTEMPELTDSFVSDRLKPLYGWKSVAEMEAGLRSSLKVKATSDYLEKYLLKNCEVKLLPEKILKFQEDIIIDYYYDYADSYEVTLEHFLKTYMHMSDIDELLGKSRRENTEISAVYLILQAIAEDAGITVSDGDVSAYFEKNTGNDDYSEYAESHGLPYLKFLTLNRKVLDYLEANAEKDW